MADIVINGVTYPAPKRVAFPGSDGQPVVFDLPEDADMGLNAYSERPVQNKVIYEAVQDVRQRQTSPYNFKGACTYANLPSSGNTVNDTWYVTDREYRMTWTGSGWQQSSMTESNYADELGALKNDLFAFNSADLIPTFATRENGVHNGVTYTWSDDFKSCTAVGTATGPSYQRLYYSLTELPNGIAPGSAYYLKAHATENFHINIAFYDANEAMIGNVVSPSSDATIVVPPDAVGMLLRLYVSKGTTVNDTIQLNGLLAALASKELTEMITALSSMGLIDAVDGAALDPNTDLDTVIGDNKIYFLTTPADYAHAPFTGSGVLMAFRLRNHTVQFAVKNTTGAIYTRYYSQASASFSDWASMADPDGAVLSGVQLIDDSASLPAGDLNDAAGSNRLYLLDSSNLYYNVPWREGRQVAGLLWVYKLPNSTVQFAMNYTDCIIYFRRLRNGAWNSWTAIAGGGGGEITVEQIYNQYNTENTVTAYPSITSDTNNYLAPTGDTTDVTASIVTMLENTGTCHLGPGDYWVSGVDMPAESALIGSGPCTRIYLLGEDTDTGYAIKLNSKCSVSNLAIYGNTTDYSDGSNTNYPPEAELVQRHGVLLQGSQSTDGKLPRRAMVSDVFIANFSGGGIACYDTGPGTAQGMNVSNVYIWHCYAGVYIPFSSEFGSYTNVKVTRCHYGCINNGGNNNFVNCQFISNITNLWMDNSLGTSINNAHSSFSSCIFGHSLNNTGINILAQGIQYGELFTSCDIFYGSVNLENCTAFSFTGCSFGQAIPINITGGALTMFDSSTFRTAPVFNIANNAATKVNNCFTWSGDQVTL